MVEEPLDAASQSLADALRASFRVLKGLMLFVLILFLFSGVYQVSNTEVGVQTRFGRQIGPPTEPGLHFAWPYPIDSITKVYTGQRTAEVGEFWLRLSDADKTKPLTEVTTKTGGLDPATDGALLTGDKAIMHLLLQVQYKVTDANAFVKNVSNVDELIRTVIQQAAVAEAARTTANVIWKDPRQLVGVRGTDQQSGIKARAQAMLDKLGSGITLENVTAERSHYPLQVRDDFIAVQDAENRMGQSIQTANKEREETLKGAAGPAWEEINDQIERLDLVDDKAQRTEIIKRIGELIAGKATGKASEKIKLAEARRDRIVSEAQSARDRFLTMLEAYRRNPTLVMDNLRQKMLGQVFSQPLLSRWILPPGPNKLILLNKNPEEIRLREVEEAKKRAGVK